MDEAQIILKLTSDFPGLFENIHKYIDLINHLMSKETDNGFYLEIVAEGLIYIYDNLSIFKLTNPEFSSQQINNFLNSHEAVLPPKKLLGGNITPDNFPKAGVSLNFIVQTDPKDTILVIKEAHLRSFLAKGVSTHAKASNDLIITFHTYESLLMYSKFLVAFFSGLSQYPPS